MTAAMEATTPPPAGPPIGSSRRYAAVAIILHWAIAFAIAFMIPLGFWMHEAVEHSDTIVAGTNAFQLHKSIGLTVLFLSLIRLGWRLANPPPPMPAHMPAWEKAVALATHWIFYVLIIGLPLTGWLYVSTAWSAHEDHALPVTTYWFHLFKVPALFGLPHAAEETRRALSHATMTTHWALAWTTVGLAALHVAAALKHQFVDRDEVLAHMVPGLKPPNETAPLPASAGRRAALGAGFAAIAACIVAVSYALLNLNPAAAPPAAAATTPAPAAAPTTASVTTPPTALAAPSGAGPSAPTPAAATAVPAWNVNQSASSIGFAAQYSDDEGQTRFNGHFNRWHGDIHFDPANLAQSSAVVTIDLASAVDGVPYHEQTLPTEPWFDVAHHATAEFRTTSIRHLAGNNYEARGTLNLKGHAIPVTLAFTLVITGAHAVMDGHVSLDRTRADIGVRDSNGDPHISHAVEVTVHVDATRG